MPTKVQPTMKIALTGPMLAGKTTVAKMLEAYHDFTIINFTDTLKEMAASTLRPYVPDLTVDTICSHKSKYRGYLQEFGTLIGFNTNPKYVTDAIEKANAKGHVVFDNVRTEEQWQTLAALGFRLVRIDINGSEQRIRSQHLGMSSYQLRAAMDNPVESWFTTDAQTVFDTGALSPQEIADLIVSEPKARKPKNLSSRAVEEATSVSREALLRAGVMGYAPDPIPATVRYDISNSTYAYLPSRDEEIAIQPVSPTLSPTLHIEGLPPILVEAVDGEMTCLRTAYGERLSEAYERMVLRVVPVAGMTHVASFRGGGRYATRDGGFTWSR